MIVITGQTATGKTKLAIEYCNKYNGELVNADSRHIYKYLDIITGKDLDELKKNNISYHLFDVRLPSEKFSSYGFVCLARPIIEDIVKRGKTPIVVGGSYFYIKHLLYGFDIKVEPNLSLRKILEAKTVGELQEKILQISPQTKTIMNNSDWNNPRRLIRKLEILKSTKPGVKESKSSQHSTDFKMIGLRHDSKSSLIQAITNRVHTRLKQGAIDEVKKIIKLGYKKTDPGLQTMGYKELIEYLEGTITQEQAIQKWITKETQYAKRQYTFMKTDPNIMWIS